jgi:hypothetical protein
MTHLTDTEIVDLLDGRLEPGRRRHVDACLSCREQAEALRAVLRSARQDQVPEPSPLFWEHLSGRVADAIRAEPLPARRTDGAWFPGWRLAAAVIVLALASGIAWQALMTRDRGVAPVVPLEERVATTADDAPEADDLDAWEVLEAAAGDLEWEDAQAIGIAYRPGSAEPLVGEMTADERAELARLIEEELKRHGA